MSTFRSPFVPTGAVLLCLLAATRASAQSPVPEASPTSPTPAAAPSGPTPIEATKSTSEEIEPQPPPPAREGASPDVAVASPKEGFGIKSADGSYSLRIRGVAQADGRFFFKGGTNTFLLRRVRPTLEGTVSKFFEYRITAELVSSPSALDAYGNVRIWKELQLRAGKFKTPFGLERLQNDPDMPFMERGLPSDLAPDRDVGAMLHGEILDGGISYAVAFLNGIGDGTSGDNDNNDKKDLVGRIFLKPLQLAHVDVLKEFGIGFAATHGTQIGPQTKYSSMGQQSFFTYADNALATGTHRRLGPQAYLYVGPIGVLGEYTRSTQIVTNGVSTSRVDSNAWQVELSGFITGENASFGTVTPKASLDPENGGFGALEVAVRYGALHVDPVTFSLGFADPNKSARSVKEWAAALNWHLVRGYKLEVDYEHSTFEGGAKGGDRQAESVVLSRLQAAF
jgi:phosphate-selective porin OprO and OprP